MSRKLAAAIISSLLIAGPASGDNSAKIQDLQQHAADARAKAAALDGQIATVTARIRGLEARVGDVSSQLALLGQDLSLHQQRLDRLNELFRLKTQRLVYLRRQYDTAVSRLSRKMVELYETHDPTLVDLMVNSSSFQDLLTRIEYLGDIAQADKQIASAVRSAKVEARVARARTRQARGRVAAETRVIAVRTEQQRVLKGQLLGTENALSARQRSKERELVNARESERQFIAEANALAAADARVRAQIAAATAASAPSAAPSSSGLIWPVSGPVTSPYGQRWGRLHAGIDIAAGSGTPIRAAASGRVIFAGWEGGYGNYTIIDHGNGLATCYAHQSSIGVSTGQSVSQGQVIGAVGNTGHSFGAHLHFEVRIGGSPVDPLGYL